MFRIKFLVNNSARYLCEQIKKYLKIVVILCCCFNWYLKIVVAQWAQVCACKCDWLWIQSLHGEMKYLILFFSSAWCRDKAWHCVPPLPPDFGGKWRKVLTLGFLYVPCHVRDKRCNWKTNIFIIVYFIKWVALYNTWHYRNVCKSTNYISFYMR